MALPGCPDTGRLDHGRHARPDPERLGDPAPLRRRSGRDDVDRAWTLARYYSDHARRVYLHAAPVDEATADRDAVVLAMARAAGRVLDVRRSWGRMDYYRPDGCYNMEDGGHGNTGQRGLGVAL